MFYVILNIIFVMLTILLILWNWWKPNKNSNFFQKQQTQITTWLEEHEIGVVVFLLILTIFTSMFRIGEVPNDLHFDEVGMAFDAKSIAENGTDRAGYQFPVYLQNYGGGQSAMYMYLTAILIKIFGYSVTIIRLPAVLLRIAMFFCLYWILKGDKKKMFLALFLFTISPYFIMQSRWGLDCNLLVGFLTIAVTFSIQAIRKNNQKGLLIGSGIFFGLSLYTYVLSYIIVPLLLVCILIYMLTIRKIKIKEILLFGIPILLLAIPLLLFLGVNNGLLPEIRGVISIPSLPSFRSGELSYRNIPKNTYMLLSIFSYDHAPYLYYNALPYFGTIYYLSIPFILIGIMVAIRNLFLSWKKQEFHIDSIFVFWFLSVLFCIAIVWDPNINKANAIFLPMLYFLVRGIQVATSKKEYTRWIILLFYLVEFILFFSYYQTTYTNERNHLWIYGYLDALEYMEDIEVETIYCPLESGSAEKMTLLLEYDIPTNQFQELTTTKERNGRTVHYNFEIPAEKDPNAGYLVPIQQERIWQELEEMPLKRKQFGKYLIYIPN